MKYSSARSKICRLSLMIFLISCTPALSQDLVGQLDQVKRELSDLKAELNDLKKVVYGLRQAVLKSGRAGSEKATAQTGAKDKQASTQTATIDDEKLTSVICRTVGDFFVEAENIVRLSDPAAAEDKMNAELDRLNSGLQGYTASHRAAKLLEIYQDLAWDTYMAVNVRGTIKGNHEFLENLAKHKKKYVDTCPKH